MSPQPRSVKLNRSSTLLMMTEPKEIRNVPSESCDSLYTVDRGDSTLPIPMRSLPASRHASITQAYYNSSNESDTIPVDAGIKTCSTKQSSQLPRWVWFAIAKCLGIPLCSNDRPIFGTFLHVVTFGTALTYFVSLVWYSVYDALLNKAQVVILHHTVTVMIVACWCALGLYAKKLCTQVFRHPHFIKDVRMHTRTFFRMNAAFLVFCLGAVFTFVNDVDSYGYYQTQTCADVDLPPFVCRMNFVSKVIFSIFALVWNSLAATIFMSVCRTHTIGIRRFIRELERDATLYEIYHAHLFYDGPLTHDDIGQETAWLEDDASQRDESFRYAEDVGFSLVNVRSRNLRSRTFAYGEAGSASRSVKDFGLSLVDVEDADEETGLLRVPIIANVNQSRTKKKRASQDSERSFERELENPVSRKDAGSTDTIDQIDDLNTDGLISPAEILHRHWKISCRLRLASSALQRWFTSFICTVIVWCAIWLVTWLKNPATLYGILQFALPLLLLPLLCSAMAEVNLEGQRVSKVICPTQERLQLIQFLSQNSLQMTVFGYTVNYGTILTVVFAILAAFVSRLMFAELGT